MPTQNQAASVGCATVAVLFIFAIIGTALALGLALDVFRAVTAQ